MATKKQAVVMAAANNIRANSSASYQAAVPKLTADNFADWANPIMANGQLFNEFYAGIHNQVFYELIYPSMFRNPLAIFKKGRVDNGAGVREYALGEVDVLPYELTDIEKQELQRAVQDMYEATYIVNMQRKYKSTLGRVQLRGFMKTIDEVYMAIDMLRENMSKWEQIDEMTMIVTMLQTKILAGKWKVIPVDMSDLDNVIIELQTIARDMEEPRRDWTELGVANNAPMSRQVVFMTNRMWSTIGVKVKAGAFNISEVWTQDRIHTLSTLSKPYYGERLEQLRKINADIPIFTDDQMALLEKVVAVVMDERVLQIWDYIYEMWEKELASTMEINYFLHVWQIFATSPFWPVAVLVDSTANTAIPETLTATVTSKQLTPQGVSYTVSITGESDSLVGGNGYLVMSDALSEGGVFVTRTGEVRMLSDAAGAPLTAEIGMTTYTAAENISTDTNVGATFTLTKNA